ncbi:TIGR03086 family metal-binding protein [Nocardioides coralli]|uniref:TIGR03086 family metal-binding protein n=1 Tax=Nocardioides coralli TaxID=2872154 RepID=UPI001CA38A3E|nr:TIGR03086 family metal-binding protein [Nocardioides coralli]QZY28271.1 TIGR03086 family protein [Nocardioides coralli]
MDLNTLYHRTVESWADHVNAVKPDQWQDPTPCTEWTVHDLVNHVTGEDRWTAPLMHGRTIEEVGDRLDGDLLGDDPIDSALRAAQEAVLAVAETLPGGGTVHLSYGEERMDEYVRQLAADHLVHGWDLAVATGADRRLDPALVHEVGAWFAEREELYRQAGVIAPRAGARDDPQAQLLSAFGRDPAWGPTHAALAQFSAAFGRGDVPAIMALMTDDCVFEATGPAPDGIRHEGEEAVRGVWEDLFATTAEATFTEEESFVHGDRGVLRWRFDWTEADGAPGHVRGVDVLRLRDGRVCEKLSYVKG